MDKDMHAAKQKSYINNKACYAMWLQYDVMSIEESDRKMDMDAKGRYSACSYSHTVRATLKRVIHSAGVKKIRMQSTNLKKNDLSGFDSHDNKK